MNQAQAMHYPWTDALAGAFTSAAGWVRGKLEAYAEARGRAIAVQHLERLSDRALYDIGLHRGQIRSVVYGDGR